MVTQTKAEIEVINVIRPSGAAEKVVKFDGIQIGIYSLVEGGFLPWGKRKPRSTEFEAIIDVIANRQREVFKQEQWLERARDAAFRQQHQFGV